MTSALAVVPSADEIEQRAATQAPRIKAAFPKDLSDAQALDVARVAVAYGLDPFLGELMPYQGRPYITFDGRVRLADRHPAYAGIDLTPATAAEIEALHIEPDQVVFKATVHRSDRVVPLVAYGRAGGKAESNPIARQWAAEVAYKRATHRALRAAFPVPIPGIEEAVSPAQLRAIHAYDADAGISRADRHTLLAERYGVTSSDQLTREQAGDYLDARQRPPVDDEQSFHIVAGDAWERGEDPPDEDTIPSDADVEFGALLARVVACGQTGSLADWDEIISDCNAADEWLTAEQREQLRPAYRETQRAMRAKYPK